jgi:hypothetical protein
MVVRKTSSARKEESGKKLPQAVGPALRKTSRKISKAQKVQLDIIAQTNFNFCDGKRIVELLKENRRMWRAALMPLNLISLRDMPDGIWHADTLYIYAEEGYQYSLEELAREQFHADEISWIGGSGAVDMLGTSEDDLAKKSHVILSVWWD